MPEMAAEQEHNNNSNGRNKMSSKVSDDEMLDVDDEDDIEII